MNKKILVVGGILVGILLVIFGAKSILNIMEKKEKENLIKEVSHFFENSPLTPEQDVYSLQLQSDAKIKTAINSENYTFDSPYILKNPYHISPLTAIVIFKTEKSKVVELTVNGRKTEFEETKNHVIPIYGLIAGKANEITLKMDGKTKSIHIDTTDIVNDLDMEIKTGEGIDLGNDIYVVTIPFSGGLYGFNTKGELVWRLTESFSLAITKLKNGHLLLGDSEYVSVEYSRKGLVEIDYLGKIYNVYDVDGGYHHDAIQLENENILVASSKIGMDTVNDYIIELDHKNGKVVNSWHLKDIANKVSNKFVEKLENPIWAFNNSIFYDKKTDSLLLSLRGRNSVMSLDYKTKNINWIFGDIKYWNQDFSKYMVSYDGVYPLGAHTVSLNSDGNVVLFDNAYDASDYHDSICEPYKTAYSSGKIFKIENMNATLISEVNDNKSFFSYAVSNYNELSNKNYLLFSSWEFEDGSMDVENCTMNQVNEGLSSNLYELDSNNQILFKAYLPFGSYRAAKLNLYDNKSINFKPVDINYFNTLDSKIYSQIKINNITSKLKNAEIRNYSYEITENLLTLNAVFQQNDEVSIVLVGKDGTTYEYLMKAKGYYLQPTVNLRGITGTYAAFLIINGVYYNMDVTYKLGK